MDMSRRRISSLVPGLCTPARKLRSGGGNGATSLRPRSAMRRLRASVALFSALAALVATMSVPVHAASASSSPTVNAGYAPVVARHSSKCMDVDNSSTAPDTQVVQRTCDGSASQKWAFVPYESNRYFIVNQNSGHCLDVRGANQQSGAVVIQWLCNGGTSQQFARNFVAGSTEYFTLTATHSNQCIDVYGGSYANGASIIQWPCGSTANQQWRTT